MITNDAQDLTMHQ